MIQLLLQVQTEGVPTRTRYGYPVQWAKFKTSMMNDSLKPMNKKVGLLMDSNVDDFMKGIKQISPSF